MSTAPAEREHLIVGTAGHIDHGKTALVKALTGIDADTLPEEKARGLTIELGFIFMDSPGLDRQIVFIDVPGHEKLVRTMVAGASNIDAALLVIAADEGISVQTREHFDILCLLDIPAGVVALTKTDLVSEDRLGAVAREIKDFLSGSFLADAPVIPVSSVTGAGIEDLRAALFSLTQKVRPRRDSGVFRMPIDRVFTMHGFGTVIAGTVLSGEVRVGDTLEIFPQGILASVRQIQVHNENAEFSFVGRRTAINLHDVRKESLHRGQCAAAPGSLLPTTRLDARLHLLQSQERELKNRSMARLHVGTDEVMCRVVLLDRDHLAPGDSALVQFQLEAPTVALPKDRFVLRTFSPLRTIGGGPILDARPMRHQRIAPDTLEALQRLEGTTRDLVEQMFLKARFTPQTPHDIALASGEGEDAVAQITVSLCQAGQLTPIPPAPPTGPGRQPTEEQYLHSRYYAALCQLLLKTLQEHLAQNPYRLLVPVALLQSRLLKLTDRQVVETLLRDLCGQGTIYLKGARLGLTGYEIRLAPAEEQAAERVEQLFKEAGFAPPLEEQVGQQLGLAPQAFERVMTSLIERERLFRLDEKVTYHKDHLEAAQQIVTDRIRAGGGLTVAELRDQLGVSRKYALALLEYLDNLGLTRREGDRHVMP